VRLERTLEAVFPALEISEDRYVVGRERILARTERIAELAEIDELRNLRLADDQLRAVLDFLVVIGEAEGKRIARIIGPLDDVDELFLDEIQNSHRTFLGSKVKCGGTRDPALGLRGACDLLRIRLG